MSEPLFERYTKYPSTVLESMGFPPQQVAFLSEVGLPTWCAPHLHFGEAGEGWKLLPVVEINTRSYVVLGEDGDDQPIVVDLETFDLWVLNQGSTISFVARDVNEFSEAMHVFQSCVNRAVDADVLAASDRRLPVEAMGPFFEFASRTLPSIVQAEAFWGRVLRFYSVPNHSVERTVHPLRGRPFAHVKR